jgi:replicative DNA helicase
VTEVIAPQDLEAEAHVLGSMLISRNAITACAEILQAADFYRPSHGLIYKAIVDLDIQDEPVDYITAADFLHKRGELEQVGGRLKLSELANFVPASANAAHYARIVRETAHLRGFVTAGQDIVRLGYERPGELADLQEQAERLIFELGHSHTIGELDHISTSLDETRALLEAHAGRDVTGTPTGLKGLDELTSGLQAGNLVVLAGRPSMGKSALALGVARHVTLLGLPVGLFTLEMSKVEVDQRLLSLQTGLPLQTIRRAKIATFEQQANLEAGFTRLRDLPLYLDDTGDIRLTELRSRARRLKARKPDLALIIVDYLQLMAAEAENRVQEVSQISRGLKALARTLAVPVLALSQLSRNLEYRNDKRPILSDLRESGAVEQDADLVIFIYRDSVYQKDADEEKERDAELIVAKHRNGPVDTISVAWDKRHARFSDA